MARDLIQQHGPSSGYTAVVVFMSDGAACDASQAAETLGALAQQYPGQFESHTVGFGSSAPRTLEHMAFSNGQQDKDKCVGNAELATAAMPPSVPPPSNGRYRAAAVGNLTEAFTAVAKSIKPGRT